MPKVEAPIIDNLQILANVQRLYIQMNIFLCAKIENTVNANLENFIHGIEYTIKFQGRKLPVTQY